MASLRQRVTNSSFAVRLLFLVLIFGALFVLGLWLDAHNSWAHSAGPTYSNPAQSAWRNELTGGLKNIYGPDWKPNRKDRHTIDAMSAQAAKTYGDPKNGDDE